MCRNWKKTRVISNSLYKRENRYKKEKIAIKKKNSLYKLSTRYKKKFLGHKEDGRVLFRILIPRIKMIYNPISKAIFNLPTGELVHFAKFYV